MRIEVRAWAVEDDVLGGDLRSSVARSTIVMQV